MTLLSAFYRAETETARAAGYQRDQLTPGIVHIGVGGFHRAHLARYQELYNRMNPHSGWSITGIGLLPSDVSALHKLNAQKGLYSLIEADKDGMSVLPIGAIGRLIAAAEEPQAAIEAMAAKETRIISTTITEGGYLYDFERHRFMSEHSLVEHDLASPEQPASLFGYLRLALTERKEKGHGPVTLMSCDNVPGNGEVFRDALLAFLNLAGDLELVDWVAENVRFPNSMVDRITPIPPTDLVQRLKAISGVEDECPVLAEPFTQWVLEDDFIAGRPAWESVGATFTDDVERFEQLKIRLLNGTHVLIAQLGYRMGVATIHELMADPLIEWLVDGFMSEDAQPTINGFSNEEIDQYKNTIKERFSNPAVADGVPRVATDGYSRLKNFLMPIVRFHLDQGRVPVRLALPFACFLKKLEEVNENGEPIALNEPALSQVQHQKMLNDRHALLKDPSYFGDEQSADVDAFKAEVQRFYHELAEQSVSDILETL